jgi:hypothetical protein
MGATEMLGIFTRKRNQVIDGFARELAGQLAARFTPEDTRAAVDSKRERKLGRALDDLHARALEFRASERLGVYGKARLGNTFKWALKEAGYDDAFIDEVMRVLVMRLGGR